ncbi:MAG: DUF2237 domain-containing protein [Thiofilum sp.]|uniref:DUF2237 family protein n=1 Tax=Thiofilum sp. TaxID=2212733 RepID=UPI0025CDF281|nr:DUF2237 domain-containing protein [Thiofilum sp.]MBK8454561.1 DUF2237 domain-containing protein [Thiofilum sp.]
MAQPLEFNVLGTELELCSTQPMTGFYRTGSCSTDAYDRGSHTICVRVTQAFLDYSLSQGNDLITPRPEFNFPGLKEGDQWCVCAMRWQEALDEGVAPRVLLRATHQAALKIVSLEDLKRLAVDLN